MLYSKVKKIKNNLLKIENKDFYSIKKLIKNFEKKLIINIC